MNANSNSNRNFISSTGNRSKIPEGNWRTNKEIQIKSVKEVVGDNPSQTKQNYFPPEPSYHPPSIKPAWSNNNNHNNNNRRNKKNIVINTTPTAPIKIKDFVYDIEQFPVLNSTQIKHVNNDTTSMLSYATIASIPIQQKPIIVTNNSLEVSSNQTTDCSWNENYDDSYLDYDSRKRNWDDDEDDYFDYTNEDEDF